jgi:hypothetical protein
MLNTWNYFTTEMIITVIGGDEMGTHILLQVELKSMTD